MQYPRGATISTYLNILKQTFRAWQQDKVPVFASSLAYYTVFSLAPLLIILISVLTWVGTGGLPGTDNAESQLFTQLERSLGPNAAQLIESMIENRAAEGGNALATVIGIVVLLVGATGLFVQLQNALNFIWGVQPNPEKGGIWRLIRVRLLSLGMILSIGFLLLASLVLTAVLEYLANSASDVLPGSDSLWVALNWGVSLGIIVVLFALILKYLPDVKVPWRPVWVGAVFTALLFVVGKQLLGLYLARPAVSSAYGAAGSLIVLLLWVFYSAQILLLGAEFTQVLAKHWGKAIQPSDTAVRRIST